MMIGVRIYQMTFSKLIFCPLFTLKLTFYLMANGWEPPVAFILDAKYAFSLTYILREGIMKVIAQ